MTIDGNTAPVAPAELVRGVQQLLSGLEDRPVQEHVAVFEGVHRSLRQALGTLDGDPH